MIRDLRGIPIFKDVFMTVELLRLEYRGNIAKAYIPYNAREALRLDPQKDKALILVHDNKTGGNLLIKDTELTRIIKPLILSGRKVTQKFQVKVRKSLAQGL